jgi:hypothetical protein
MDSIDGTDGMDNMDTIQFDQPGSGSGASPGGGPGPRRARWSGRRKRVVTTVAASTLLLGSGAAIGVALTGGASAATGGTSPGTGSNTSATTTAAASSLAGKCARLAQRLQSHGHRGAATQLRFLCRDPLRRLVLVGGEHGEVTFQTKAGPKTIAIERGTIQSTSAAGITVQAKDGTTWTWDYMTNTAVRDARHSVSRTSLTTGETVLVVGPVVSGVHDARLIRVRAGS